ncbi:MAG: DUF1269 domain-containing protein [Pseudomonadota bacterium]|nr:DUF1269 domain-containing protein [Pseudomonadota bacterium]
MAKLIVVGFDNSQEADRALTELGRLQREYLLDLEDAVVAIRDPDGKLRLKQNVDLVNADTASGGLWGPLGGLLFLNPLIGMVVGAALGAGSKALPGSLADYRIDDDFIRSISETLQPNTSALFVLVRKALPDKVLAEISSHIRGRVIRSSLSPEQEARLQAALSGGAVAMPGATLASGAETSHPRLDGEDCTAGLP